jgi:hypothetical protein
LLAYPTYLSSLTENIHHFITKCINTLTAYVIDRSQTFFYVFLSAAKIGNRIRRATVGFGCHVRQSSRGGVLYTKSMGQKEETDRRSCPIILPTVRKVETDRPFFANCSKTIASSSEMEKANMIRIKSNGKLLYSVAPYKYLSIKNGLDYFTRDSLQPNNT